MAVAATGFFDGVHLGHARVIETLVREACRRGEESLVLTFWPHPRTVLQDDARSLRLLTSLEEKRILLHEAGVDRVEVLPFTREFASESAEQYLRELVRDSFGVTTVVFGYDNRMGADNILPAESASLVRRLGMTPVLCEPFSVSSGKISSTQIRRFLREGAVEDASGMLGRYYSMTGVVVAGNRLGRTLGYPTANIQLYEPLKVVPGNGVYLTEVLSGGKQYWGMTNIGVRPTVGDNNAVTIETHILDFDEDIYGLDLTLRFVRRIRSERRFDSLAELKVQIAKDETACRRFVHMK